MVLMLLVFILLCSSLKVLPMCDSHYEGVQALSAALSASDDLLTDVKYYLQAGRDPLDQVQTLTHHKLTSISSYV